MRKSVLVLLAAFAAQCAALDGAAAQSPSAFRWHGAANSPPEATETSYYLHRSLPRDPTVHDVYLQCRKGDPAIRAAFVSARQGRYRNDELMGADAQAVFIVDGKRLEPVSVTLSQAEGFDSDQGAFVILYDLEVDEPLFDALVKGKSFRFELPKATSHTIPLTGFARHALAMKKQCF